MNEISLGGMLSDNGGFLIPTLFSFALAFPIKLAGSASAVFHQAFPFSHPTGTSNSMGAAWYPVVRNFLVGWGQ